MSFNRQQSIEVTTAIHIGELFAEIPRITESLRQSEQVVAACSDAVKRAALEEIGFSQQRLAELESEEEKHLPLLNTNILAFFVISMRF